MITELVPRPKWHGLDGVTYLYTGAHAPALRAGIDVAEWACAQQSAGPSGREALFAMEEEARTSIAKLAGLDDGSVAFVGDASTAWNSVAGALLMSPGDNVVLNELEHPSVLYPFLRLRDRGLEVRVVPRDGDWRVKAEAIDAACDDRTRAIAVSHVAYVNGFRHDLAALRAVADGHGAALFADVSHSLGVVPVDASLVDIGISASYKWLLGTYGVGVLMWNRDRLPKLRPGMVGWRSTENIFTDDRFTRIPMSDDARRFQIGAPAFPSIAALRAGVDQLLSIDRSQVADHAEALSTLCMAALRDRGLNVITPNEPADRAGNVAFLHPHAETVAARLAERGVYAWGGDGRIRVSFHVMCGQADVDAFTAALDEILPQCPAEVAVDDGSR